MYLIWPELESWDAPQDVIPGAAVLTVRPPDADCNCAYPDCGGYAMHEPHCGEDFFGELGRDLLPASLWDFTQIGAGYDAGRR